MNSLIKPTDSVLLWGNGELAASVALCLLNAGHMVNVCTENVAEFEQLFNNHISSQKKHANKHVVTNNFHIGSELNKQTECKLVVAISEEDLRVKQQLIEKLEAHISSDTILAINTDSFALETLQKDCRYPGRIVGVNWTEPAHTTFFLEIITCDNNPGLAEEISSLAKTFWAKDPYIVKNEGLRGRLVSAMAREASFLVDNGYASIDDIDRACRNDAGYYLPFSGTSRYMDLMGTYAYGMVMKDLNPELSKDKELPDFMKKILQEGGLGIENKSGFYKYSEEDVVKWKNTMEKFSYQIQSIIKKYPFNYDKENIEK